MSTIEARKVLLEDAAHIVAADRNTQYGEPEDTFHQIALLWSVYTGTLVTDADVANMMILMKMARLKHNPDHRDSWLDMAGYAACGWSTVVNRMTS